MPARTSPTFPSLPLLPRPSRPSRLSHLSHLGLTLLVMLCLAVSGCFGSGGKGRSSDGSSTTGLADCGAATSAETLRSSPGVYNAADANTVDEGSGERTLRWDLAVPAACDRTGAMAHVEATLLPPPTDCPPLRLNATVTTGVTESEVPLEGEGALAGSLPFTPRAAAAGTPGSFVVSLSAVFDSDVALRDQQCVDATLQSLRLQASFAEPAASA